MSSGGVNVERYFKRFLEKLLDLLRKNSAAVLGRWVVYDPEKDEIKLLDSRDSAMKYIYSELQDRKYVFITHIPFESEEAFYGFSRLFQRLLSVDILAEMRKQEKA